MKLVKNFGHCRTRRLSVSLDQTTRIDRPRVFQLIKNSMMLFVNVIVRYSESITPCGFNVHAFNNGRPSINVHHVYVM